ncbi:MAG: HD domain-containing protein [Anaerolineaceae bacterium]|nr:HD domain-containing protein [Anaerolineaceae bacterium]
MKPNISISLLDFSTALSQVLDLASFELAQHQLRTAFLAWRVAEELGMDTNQQAEIIFSSLLHDVGAMTPEEKFDLHEGTYEENIHLHCEYGAKILQDLPLFERSAGIIRFHHTDWQDWETKKSPELMLLSQTVYLADLVEREIDRDQFILHQDNEIIKTFSDQSGSTFHPEVVEAFKSAASKEDFWLNCVSPNLLYFLRENAPGHAARIQEAELIAVSEVVRKLIDFRSSFTATHSTGVSTAARLIAESMGFSEDQLDMIQFAGNLHDVGKLVIPNRILEKPDKLSWEEYALIRQHSYFTSLFMRECKLPRYLVDWASLHHERLNGQGYPFHFAEMEISMGSRIIAAADVLIALAEERPYRHALDKKHVLSELNKMVESSHLDRDIVSLLESQYEDFVEPTLEKQREAARFFSEEKSMMNI